MALRKQIVIALAFLIVACDQHPGQMPGSMVPQVGVVTLKAQPVTLSSELTGRVTGTMVSDVRPQVGGIIQKRLFNEGDEVKAGQVLYQIDPASYQASYDEAVAQLQNAVAIR